MKEIMIPYVLICWLLLKFGVVARTTRNYTIMVGLGLLLAFVLFTAHRYFSPADLTLSTTVRAPRSVLSPAVGQQIDKIYIVHNEKVKKGQLLYTLVDDNLKSQESSAVEDLNRAEIEHSRLIRDYDRKKNLESGAIAVTELESSKDDVLRSAAEVTAAKAKLENIHFELGRLNVVAPYDGQVSHIDVGEGSRLGALHIWDTGHKYVVMRIPDQAYGFIKPGQFAEFYVDTYPGHIFRARVQSITGATGEAAGSLLPQEESVGRQITLGSAPVGRTVILEFEDPEGLWIPIGATGSAWISAEKPAILGFMDVIGAATVRLYSAKAYLGAL